MTKNLTILFFFLSIGFLNCTRKSYYKCGLAMSSNSPIRPKIDSKILKLERTSIVDTNMALIVGTIHSKDSLDEKMTTSLLENAYIFITNQSNGKGYWKSTNTNGKYQFYLPPSTYDLKVYSLNYNGLIIRNVEFSNGDIIEFDAQLGQSDGREDSTVYTMQSDRTIKLISEKLKKRKMKS